jgi:hypothetical protein
MTMRNWVSMLLVCLALMGCVSAQQRPLTKATKATCDGSSQCTVAVSVTCPDDPQINCSISVTPDLVWLKYSANNNKITWLLPQGSSFMFPDDGIVLDDSTAFRCGSDGPRKFVCMSNRSDFGIYKYDVSVKASSGTRKADPLDPFIVNN